MKLTGDLIYQRVQGVIQDIGFGTEHELDSVLSAIAEALYAPLCPWLEVNTVVRIDNLALFQLWSSGWRCVADDTPVDYATDIAPFNPVRLVPEVAS